MDHLEATPQRLLLRLPQAVAVPGQSKAWETDLLLMLELMDD